MEWLQVQSMSGVFSIASQTALQYLPEVTTHVQIGCAHRVDLGSVILFAPVA